MPAQQDAHAAAAAGGQQLAAGGGEVAALDAAVRHYAGLLFVQRLRTADDRQHATEAFAEAWGQQEQQQQQQQQHPELHISADALKIGLARLSRASSAPPAAGGRSTAEQLALLPSQLPVLESLAGENMPIGREEGPIPPAPLIL